jgi:hypothetical protein
MADQTEAQSREQSERMSKEAEERRKEQFEREKQVSEHIRKDAQERLSRGRPTPTQEENDRAALGEHVFEKEDDGSGPDPNVVEREKRDRERGMEPGKGGGYQTRQVQPRAATPPRSPSSSTS